MDPRTLSGWQGYNPYSSDELLAIQMNLEAESAWFTKQNMTFLILPCFDKNSIYPEYLPWPYADAIGPSRLAQIFEHMKLHSKVQLVDVRQPLLTAKKLNQFDTYFKTDSHWNNIGAFYAYKEIVKRLLIVYPQFVPHNLEDFVLDTNLKRAGDLAGMANLDVSHILEHQLVSKKNITANRMSPKKDKILIFGDSFSDFFFKDYFWRHFNEVKYVYGYSNARYKFDKSTILQYRPNVVIIESIERFWINP
ncbi:unnamed protein product [Rotaria socialis]|uniref:AlgX/AlgJ SGNH hydrolase-like domain-containing protein n=2 Tax=Rotaria TaxID=231623 RepID=A0A816CPL7_9BILA|nr:unnamed protein product [Rotaria magnacalcarata]CAF3044748.1 unnamed protein product [Rotaria socialis]CAF1663545.1 unnamed protein product [Rotaria magnacalcarata]CAF3419446.1 unnamed protein product [Rotaria socialis]CAF3629780.1 unnamed protein product [Rotaria socialis]